MTTQHDPRTDGDCCALRTRIEHILTELLLPEKSASHRLHQAMCYACLGAGKRLRALFTYTTGLCFGANLNDLDFAAASVELIHAYSLVHDDLPSMDDDDWRRGKPSCHKAFDEPTAILVGDALQSLAFEALSQPNERLETATQLKMLNLLAKAVGSNGMVGGQMLDVQNEIEPMAKIENIHALKTGALIKISILFGALIAKCDENSMAQLTQFADAVGIAFQIKDDILDVEGNSSTLGKTAGIDSINHRYTAIKASGLTSCKKRAKQLIDQAKEALSKIPDDTLLLNQLTQHIEERGS